MPVFKPPDEPCPFCGEIMPCRDERCYHQYEEEIGSIDDNEEFIPFDYHEQWR